MSDFLKWLYSIDRPGWLALPVIFATATLLVAVAAFLCGLLVIGLFFLIEHDNPFPLLALLLSPFAIGYWMYRRRGDE